MSGWTFSTQLKTLAKLESSERSVKVAPEAQLSLLENPSRSARGQRFALCCPRSSPWGRQDPSLGPRWCLFGDTALGRSWNGWRGGWEAPPFPEGSFIVALDQRSIQWPLVHLVLLSAAESQTRLFLAACKYSVVL